MNRKVLYFLIILILITGCNDKKTETNKHEEISEQINEQIIDNNNIVSNDNKEVDTLEETNKPSNTETSKKNSTTNSQNKNNNITNNNIFTPKPSNAPAPTDLPKPIPTPNPVPTPSPSPIVKIDAIKEYYCIGNFQLTGTKCISKISVDALSKYVCDKGELQGSKCNVTSTIVHTPNPYGGTVQSCSQYSGSGYYQTCLCNKEGGTYDSINQKCYKTITTSINATLEYYCTSGTSLVGNKCEKEYSTDAPFKLTCPADYKLNGIYCEK